MPETDLFLAAEAVAKRENPWAILARNWKAMALVVGITIGGTSAFYTYTTYMQKFLKLSVGLNDSQTTLITAGSLLFAIILQAALWRTFRQDRAQTAADRLRRSWHHRNASLADDAATHAKSRSSHFC